jgi:hypothetical protein
MNTRISIVAATIGITIGGCSSVNNGAIYGATERTEAAQLVAEKGSVWGAFIQSVATTAIHEVDGQPFKGYRHPIKIDDKLFLSPGLHFIGIRVWGSPKGYPPAGTESFACLHVKAEAKGNYVLRGFIEDDHFRVELIQKMLNSEQTISSVRMAGGIKRGVQICAKVL